MKSAYSFLLHHPCYIQLKHINAECEGKLGHLLCEGILSTCKDNSLQHLILHQACGHMSLPQCLTQTQTQRLTNRQTVMLTRSHYFTYQMLYILHCSSALSWLWRSETGKLLTDASTKLALILQESRLSRFWASIQAR